LIDDDVRVLLLVDLGEVVDVVADLDVVAEVLLVLQQLMGLLDILYFLQFDGYSLPLL